MCKWQQGWGKGRSECIKWRKQALVREQARMHALYLQCVCMSTMWGCVRVHRFLLVFVLSLRERECRESGGDAEKMEGEISVASRVKFHQAQGGKA